MNTGTAGPLRGELLPKKDEDSAKRPPDSSVGKPRPLPASSTLLALPNSAAFIELDKEETGITAGLSASCIANCLKEIKNQRHEIKDAEVQAKEKVKSIREATQVSGSFFCVVPAAVLLCILINVYFDIFSTDERLNFESTSSLSNIMQICRRGDASIEDFCLSFKEVFQNVSIDAMRLLGGMSEPALIPKDNYFQLCDLVSTKPNNGIMIVMACFSFAMMFLTAHKLLKLQAAWN